MKYVIICNGTTEFSKVFAAAKIVSFSGEELVWGQTGKPGIAFFEVSAEGAFMGWQDDCSKFAYWLNQSTKDVDNVKVVLSADILDGTFKCPWIAVEDAKHPPKGYKLLTEKERETTLKPKGCKIWGTSNTWEDVSEGVWDARRYGTIYCYPINTVLELKEVEMTMTEVCKALGKNIKIVEG